MAPAPTGFAQILYFHEEIISQCLLISKISANAVEIHHVYIHYPDWCGLHRWLCHFLWL